MPEFGQVPGGGRPYGNIFTVSTPHIDQLANQLYAEQKQREVVRQKQAQVLDEEFRKNVANIRDADIPEYTKKYNDYKLARQSLMRLKPGNQDKFIEQQMEAQRKLADVYSYGNASKRAKEEEEEMGKDYLKNPNNYDDNALGYLSTRRKLPLTQLNQYKVKGEDGKESVIDLSNPETFRYKGSNTDFGTILDKAIGQPKQVYSEEIKVDPEGRQTDVIPYTFGNTPAQVKDRLVASFALHQAARDAEHQWDTIPQKEKDETVAAFKAIPAEKWKKMGVDNPQDLLPKNGDNKAESLASLMAMQYALSNEPKQGTPLRRNNQAVIDERNFQQQKELEGMRQKNRVGLEAMKQSYRKNMVDYRKKAGTKEGENILNDYINRQYDENKNNHEVRSVKGKWQPVRRIYVPQEIVKKYSKGDGKTEILPKFYISEDKKYVIPVYPGESSQKSDPILIETFKGDLGKVWLSKKDAKSEMADDLDVDEDENDQGGYVPSSQPAEDDGYSRSELKSAGWTDEQITNASKAGKIKLK